MQKILYCYANVLIRINIAGIFSFFVFFGYGQGYKPPRKSSETAKYEYANSHPVTPTSSVVKFYIPVSNTVDKNVIQKLVTSADMGADEYYVRLRNQEDAQRTRDGIMLDSDERWKARIAEMKAREWPAKMPKFEGADTAYAAVRHQGKMGIIDKKGNIVVPIIWYSAGSFCGDSNLAVVTLPGADGKSGLLDKNNKLWIPLKYDRIHSAAFNEGLCGVMLGKKWGFIDLYDDVVIPFIYTDVSKFENGKAIVSTKEKYGVIDYTGKEIIPIKYERIQNGWLIFQYRHKGKWGAFDKEGKPMIDPIYEDSFYFILEKAKVTLNGRTFFIDKSGKEVPGS